VKACCAVMHVTVVDCCVVPYRGGLASEELS
jgi:hypothetical protein